MFESLQTPTNENIEHIRKELMGKEITVELEGGRAPVVVTIVEVEPIAAGSSRDGFLPELRVRFESKYFGGPSGFVFFNSTERHSPVDKKQCILNSIPKAKFGEITSIERRVVNEARLSALRPHHRH